MELACLLGLTLHLFLMLLTPSSQPVLVAEVAGLQLPLLRVVSGRQRAAAEPLAEAVLLVRRQDDQPVCNSQPSTRADSWNASRSFRPPQKPAAQGHDKDEADCSCCKFCGAHGLACGSKRMSTRVARWPAPPLRRHRHAQTRTPEHQPAAGFAARGSTPLAHGTALHRGHRLAQAVWLWVQAHG